MIYDKNGKAYRDLIAGVSACCLGHSHPELIKTIQTHCVVALAEHEDLVDNRATRKIAKNLPNAELLEFPGSRHELLMEQDKYRAPLLNSFQKLVKDRIIDNPEALKTF